VLQKHEIAVLAYTGLSYHFDEFATQANKNKEALAKKQPPSNQIDPPFLKAC